MIFIPPYARKAIDILTNAGYDAYIVGGCVRDALLGKDANDYDITTNALPQNTAEVFSSYHVIDTGIKHGTVTVVIDKMPIEITTFRIDGEYKDNRRPENVEFTANIQDDLARRDFTINAMAYSPEKGIVDCYNGRDDLKSKIIRCVGDADTRFNEDALRILRALRFASVLGFDIHAETKKSIHKNSSLLKNIASERIQAEFFKLVCGENAAKIVSEYKDVLAVFMPQISKMFGFEQRNKYHNLDVWNHSLKAFSYTEQKLCLRLAALFHDIGKPDSYTVDENGCGHFYSHAKTSISLTRDILNSLKCDNATKHRVIVLIENHDNIIHPTKKNIKKMLGKLDKEVFFELMELQKADSYAHAEPYDSERISYIDEIISLAKEIINEGECFSTKMLAVDGHDMISIGLSSTRIGKMLSTLLDLVISGKVENEKNTLIETAKKIIDAEKE